MAKGVVVMTRKPGEPRRQFTSTMREDLFLSLQSESERTGVPMSKLLDRAWEEYTELRKLNTPTT